MRFCRARKLADDAQMQALALAMGALQWATENATGRDENQFVPTSQVAHVTRAKR
ncbi:hypothetical protein SAMN05421548_11725 [Paraburkholderia lycopersici]|uniref:Uncharacterized protein n=1 Tax=Paraburkholderia lycopersici TaxID=416944 RepID=A0A1G6THB8_9BURK|nr:hypothetical protein SAMN05421548_11725 [Paraburkholderia lycopersici]